MSCETSKRKSRWTVLNVAAAELHGIFNASIFYLLYISQGVPFLFFKFEGLYEAKVTLFL